MGMLKFQSLEKPPTFLLSALLIPILCLHVVAKPLSFDRHFLIWESWMEHQLTYSHLTTFFVFAVQLSKFLVVSTGQPTVYPPNQPRKKKNNIKDGR
jgi:choline-glycine betaine transporter